MPSTGKRPPGVSSRVGVRRGSDTAQQLSNVIIISSLTLEGRSWLVRGQEGTKARSQTMWPMPMSHSRAVGQRIRERLTDLRSHWSLLFPRWVGPDPRVKFTLETDRANVCAPARVCPQNRSETLLTCSQRNLLPACTRSVQLIRTGSSVLQEVERLCWVCSVLFGCSFANQYYPVCLKGTCVYIGAPGKQFKCALQNIAD